MVLLVRLDLQLTITDFTDNPRKNQDRSSRVSALYQECRCRSRIVNSSRRELQEKIRERRGVDRLRIDFHV